MATNTPMANRYRAFISYSHADEKWAKWLLRSLEAYRVPRHIVERYALDTNRLIPIFRDREELASSGDLSATIQNALTESTSLIEDAKRLYERAITVADMTLPATHPYAISLSEDYGEFLQRVVAK